MGTIALYLQDQGMVCGVLGDGQRLLGWWVEGLVELTATSLHPPIKKYFNILTGTVIQVCPSCVAFVSI